MYCFINIYNKNHKHLLQIGACVLKIHKVNQIKLVDSIEVNFVNNVKLVHPILNYINSNNPVNEKIGIKAIHDFLMKYSNNLKIITNGSCSFWLNYYLLKNGYKIFEEIINIQNYNSLKISNFKKIKQASKRFILNYYKTYNVLKTSLYKSLYNGFKFLCILNKL